MERVVECGECRCERPVDGRVLLCTHVLCEKCLLDNLTGANEVKCPTCGQTTKSRGGGQMILHRSLPLARTYFYPASSYISPSLDTRLLSPEDVGDADPEHLFCFSCDDDVLVTHICSDCRPAQRFCARHTAKHVKRKDCAFHVPRLLPTATCAADLGNGSIDSPPAPVQTTPESECDLHPGQYLWHYCRTCQVMLCGRCMSTSHREHTVVTANDAADELVKELQCQVHAVLAAPESQPDTEDSCATNSSTGGQSSGTAFDGCLKEVCDMLKSIEDQAQTASDQIGDRFDAQLQKAVERSKEEALRKVDDLRRIKEDQLRDQHRRLESAKETGLALQQMVSVFSSRPTLHAIDILTMGLPLLSAVQTIKSVWQANQMPCCVAAIRAVTDDTATASAVDALKSSVDVWDYGVDLKEGSKMVVMPKHSVEGKPVNIELELRQADGQPLPVSALNGQALQVRCTSPDGSVETLDLAADGDHRGIFSAKMKSAQAGRYIFECTAAGQSAECIVHDEPHWFDVESSTENVLISANGKCAQHAGCRDEPALVVGGKLDENNSETHALIERKWVTLSVQVRILVSGVRPGQSVCVGVVRDRLSGPGIKEADISGWWIKMDDKVYNHVHVTIGLNPSRLYLNSDSSVSRDSIPGPKNSGFRLAVCLSQPGHQVEFF